MQLVLYRDFAKKRNSTALPGNSIVSETLTVRLKENCSTISPVFIVNASYGVNYTYAHFKSRYYFIDDIVSLNNGNVEIHCSVDVLATYRNYIASYTAFVERCADSSNYDVMLIDPLIARSTDIYQINKITKDSRFIGDNFCYFFRTVSGEGIQLYATPDPTTLSDIMFPQSGEQDWNQIRNDMWIATYNPAAYLLDYYKIPVSKILLSPKHFVPTCSWGFHKASLSYEDPDSPGVLLYKDVDLVEENAGFTISLNDIHLPSSGYYDFRRYAENWSSYFIWLPLIGLQQIPSQYADDTLELVYDVDAVSGDCMVRIRTTQDEGAPIAVFNANIKQQLQISTVNTDWQTFASSAAGSFSDALTLDFGGMVGDIWNEQKAINQPIVNVIGSPSGNSYSGKKHDNVTTFAISYKGKDIPVSKAGRPCYKNLQLSSLAGTGFVKCAGSSISIPGTNVEKEMLNALLNGGFYME